MDFFMNRTASDRQEVTKEHSHVGKWRSLTNEGQVGTVRKEPAEAHAELPRMEILKIVRYM